MPKIALTGGDFGEGPAAADSAAFHLPDPARRGATLVVPFGQVAEIAMVGSDNTARIKSAFRSGLRGVLAAGPAGLSVGLLAAHKAADTVFSVRLKDGRGFLARAAAADFADIHAAQVAAASAERAHPADGVIERYLSGRDKLSLPEQTNAGAEPLSPALPSPAPLPAAPVPSSPKARPLPRPPAIFGKRGR